MPTRDRHEGSGPTAAEPPHARRLPLEPQVSSPGRPAAFPRIATIAALISSTPLSAEAPFQHRGTAIRPPKPAPESTPLPPEQPRPNQTVSTGTPPKSPSEVRIDSGTAPAPPRRVIPELPIWRRQRIVRNPSSASSPGSQFNPDPGGRRSAPLPEEPLYQSEPAPAARFEGDAIPEALKAPRTGQQESVLVPQPSRRPAALPGEPGYGTDPLPPELRLPRRNVRINDKLELHVDGTPEYPLADRGEAAHPFSTAVPNRYEIGFGFTPWRRYTSGLSEQPYDKPGPRLWHPYEQSRLKGDLPIWGQDKFLNITATSDTAVEFRRVPTPSAVSTARADSAEFFGRGESYSIQQTFGVAFDLFEGETSFKPPHWSVKLLPVFNVNYARVQENNLLSPDPRGIDRGPNTPPPPNGWVSHPGDIGTLLNGQLGQAGDGELGARYVDRTRTYFALQEYSAEYHLGDLSDNYDFFAVKAGSQGYNHDFRGFLFNDVNLGGRLFGNWDNNRWQYNLAGFDLREKDTFSGLNSFDQRNQKVFFANAYRQDLFWPGYTSQLSFAANLDEPGIHYDRTGSLVRPAPFGTPVPHGLQAFYFGWAGDGHIGRWNVSHQVYQAVGRDDLNPLAGHRVDLNAQMAALEVSYDRDWLRYKASFFYASGDHNSTDSTAGGFDGIVDNPNFTGGAFSYYVHQGLNLGGTAVALKQPNSLFPNLRTSKTQGQANFVNPGIFIYSVGVDIDTTPKLRTFLNFNYLRFAETDALQTALLQDTVRGELGFDLSLGFQYRPLLTDNLIFTAGIGVLIPGGGYRDLYRRSTDPVPGFDDLELRRTGQPDAFLYSGVLALNLTY